MIGEFTLRARLGSGGMGRVYLGFSPGGRAVAIKVVHPGLARDPEFLQRFGREVASARAVSGVYTAPVVASGLHDDPPWMATAFVPGPPLSDVVTRLGPLPEAAAWRLAAGLAEALRAVHDASLVHRDLKPSNVLMAPDGPHVIDFGISRAFEGTVLTSTGTVVGTPGYMSPEQAEGQTAGPPSDVFSLGCVLAYAATGSAPFGAGSAASVLYRVVTAEPDLRPVPERLRQVIAACLSKRPAERTGLSQLSAMIGALGPALEPGLGSFWPEPVASYVLGSGQGYPAPTQVSSAPAGSAGPAGPVPGNGWAQASGPGSAPVSPAQSGWTPSVAASMLAAQSGQPAGQPLGQPGAEQGSRAAAQPVPTATSLGGMQPGTGLQDTAQPGTAQAGAPQTGAPQTGLARAGVAQAGVAQPGLGQAYAAPQTPPAGGTGHAPMVADGYYAAATRGPDSGGFVQSPYPQPPAAQSWPPQYPGSQSQQPSWPGAGTSGASDSSGASSAQAAPATWYAAAQQSATPWPQPAPAAPWPRQGSATPPPGLPGPLAQYTPGHRRPAVSELPGSVRTAIRLMYAGTVATALYVLLGAAAVHNYNVVHALKMANDVRGTAVLGGAVGVMCWIAAATSARRGHGWTRGAGTVLLAIHTVGMLTDLVLLKDEVGVKATSAVIWGIGLAAVIMLWSQESGAFFQAWRRR